MPGPQPDHSKDQTVLDLLAADKHASVRDLAALMGVSNTAVQHRLNRLRRLGKLELKQAERRLIHR